VGTLWVGALKEYCGWLISRSGLHFEKTCSLLSASWTKYCSAAGQLNFANHQGSAVQEGVMQPVQKFPTLNLLFPVIGEGFFSLGSQQRIGSWRTSGIKSSTFALCLNCIQLLLLQLHCLESFLCLRVRIWASLALPLHSTRATIQEEEV
jgi:hypothetical protein